MGLPNTEGVEVDNFPAIKADWYGATLIGGEDAVDKNGNSYTKLHFGLEDNSRQAWCNISHQIDFLWKVKQFKLAIQMADAEENLEPYFGTKLEIYCQNREYHGKNYAEVTQFRTKDGADAQPPSKEDDEIF